MLSGDDIAQRTGVIMRSIIEIDAHNRMVAGRALHDVYGHFAHADGFHVLVVEEERIVPAATADPQPTLLSQQQQQQQQSGQSGACRRYYRVKALDVPEVADALSGPKRSPKRETASPIGAKGQGKEVKEERQEIHEGVVSRRRCHQFTFDDYCQYHLPNQKLHCIMCRIRETLLADLFRCVLRTTYGPDAQDRRSADADDMDIALQVAPSTHRCFQPLMTRCYDRTGRNPDAWLAQTCRELEQWLMDENQLPVRRFMLDVWARAKSMAGHSHGVPPSRRRQLSCTVFRSAYNEVRGTTNLDGRLRISCPPDANGDRNSFGSNHCSSDSVGMRGPDKETPRTESANAVALPLACQDDISATTKRAGQPIVSAAIAHNRATTPPHLTTLYMALTPTASSRATMLCKRSMHGPGEQETCVPPTAKRRRCTERPRGATGDRRAGGVCDADSARLDGVLPVATTATVAGTPGQQYDCAAAVNAAGITLLLAAEALRADTVSASATAHAHYLSRLTIDTLAEHYRSMSNIMEMHKTILPRAFRADITSSRSSSSSSSSSTAANTNNRAALPQAPPTTTARAGTLDRPQSARHGQGVRCALGNA